MIRTRRVLFAPVAAVSLTATLMLTGCFANPIEGIVKNAAGGAASEEAGKKMAEDIIEKATGGEVDAKLGKMPADFPKAVPTPDLKVVSGLSLKGQGPEEGTTWTVMYEAADAEAETTKVREALLGAGFEEVAWGNFGGMITGSFKNTDYIISVGGLPGDGGEPGMITYGVVENVKK